MSKTNSISLVLGYNMFSLSVELLSSKPIARGLAVSSSIFVSLFRTNSLISLLLGDSDCISELSPVITVKATSLDTGLAVSKSIFVSKFSYNYTLIRFILTYPSVGRALILNRYCLSLTQRLR